jgi:hypothetical protein
LLNSVLIDAHGDLNKAADILAAEVLEKRALLRALCHDAVVVSVFRALFRIAQDDPSKINAALNEAVEKARTLKRKLN